MLPNRWFWAHESVTSFFCVSLKMIMIRLSSIAAFYCLFFKRSKFAYGLPQIIFFFLHEHKYRQKQGLIMKIHRNEHINEPSISILTWIRRTNAVSKEWFNSILNCLQFLFRTLSKWKINKFRIINNNWSYKTFTLSK